MRGRDDAAGHARRDGVRLARAGLACALAALAAFLWLADPPWRVEGGPAFLAATRHRPFASNVAIGLWWAAALNAVLCAVLLAGAAYWAAPVAVRRGAAPPRTARFAAAVVLAVLAAGALRAPLASRSLWWDEAWVVRQVLVGQYLGPDDDPQAWRFRSGGLQRALWYAKKPTNHALYSVAAWPGLRAWRALTGAAPDRFSEPVYRLPALAGALGSVVALALLVRALGFPRAGPLAAWLLALHPWHVRYGVDGRAYSLVVLFATTAALGLVRFLRSGAWRDLALSAVSHFLLVWSWSFAAFLTAGLGAAGLAALAAGPWSRADRARLAARFTAAHGLAGMAFLQVFAPNLTLVHLWDYTGEVVQRLPDLWAGLSTGMLWDAFGARDPGIPELRRLSGERPALALFAFGLAPAGLVAGLVAIARRDAAARATALGWAVAGPVSMAVTEVTGRHFFPRFQVFLLPLLVACWAVALDVSARAAAARLPARGRAAAAALPVAALAFFALVTWPQTRLLLERPYTPLRDVAAFLAARGPAVRAGYGFATGVLKVYDPTIRYVGSAAELRSLCRRARGDGLPLYVAFGYPAHNARRADGVALLEDPARFETVAAFGGIEPEFGFRVFRAGPDACPGGAEAPGGGLTAERP
jgi:hypothetical protein